MIDMVVHRRDLRETLIREIGLKSGIVRRGGGAVSMRDLLMLYGTELKC